VLICLPQPEELLEGGDGEQCRSGWPTLQQEWKCTPQRAAKAHLYCKSLTFNYLQHALQFAHPDRSIWGTLVTCGHLPRRRKGPLVLIMATFCFPADCDIRESNGQCSFTYQAQNCSCAPKDRVYWLECGKLHWILQVAKYTGRANANQHLRFSPKTGCFHTRLHAVTKNSQTFLKTLTRFWHTSTRLMLVTICRNSLPSAVSPAVTLTCIHFLKSPRRFGAPALPYVFTQRQTVFGKSARVISKPWCVLTLQGLTLTWNVCEDAVSNAQQHT